MSGTEEASTTAQVGVGDMVRLTTGVTIEVRGIRRGPGGVSLLGLGPDWFDGAGAVVVTREG